MASTPPSSPVDSHSGVSVTPTPSSPIVPNIRCSPISQQVSNSPRKTSSPPPVSDVSCLLKKLDKISKWIHSSKLKLKNNHLCEADSLIADLREDLYSFIQPPSPKEITTVFHNNMLKLTSSVVETIQRCCTPPSAAEIAEEVIQIIATGHDTGTQNQEERPEVSPSPPSSTSSPKITKNIKKNYAKVASSAAAPRQQRPIRPPPILIKAPDYITKSIKDILEPLIPQDINILSSRTFADKSFLLQVATNEDKEKIDTIIKSLPELTATLPHQRWPRLILFGIPKTYSEKEIIENILKTTSYTTEDCKIRFRLGKKEDTSNIVIEVKPSLGTYLLHRGRIFFRWTSYRLEVYRGITRCFQCHRYGHVQKYCREEKIICGHCAQSGHPSKECKYLKHPPTCINCFRAHRQAGHDVSSSSCPEYIKACRINSTITSWTD